ncbi:unnamed protein product [marine sediment metagenome]|uniref:Uncharacterized protein n=1 Tax=marine sediment metagenome TaxID=412755 RepID=X1MMN1_9ZZZZ
MKKERKKARPLKLFDSNELEDIDLDLEGDLKDVNLDLDLEDIKIDVDLKDLDFDNPFQERSLEYLRQSFLKMERKLEETKREYEKAQKDYYIRFMIEGVEGIENKKVAEERIPRERTHKKKTVPSRRRN